MSEQINRRCKNTGCRETPKGHHSLCETHRYVRSPHLNFEQAQAELRKARLEEKRFKQQQFQSS